MKEFERWIRKAESDFLNLKNNFAGDELSCDTACFHAQQAVDKYLKAYLIVKNIIFSKTNDLKVLIDQCIEINKNFKEIETIARRLSEFGVAPRYSGYLDEISEADAKQAFENALHIKEFVLKNFFN